MKPLISASTSNRPQGSSISACREPTSWSIVSLECRGQCRWLLPFWSNIEEWPIVKPMGWSREEGRSSILMMDSLICSRSSKGAFRRLLEKSPSRFHRRKRTKEGITLTLARLTNKIGWTLIAFYQGTSPSRRHCPQINWEILNPNMRSSVKASLHRRARLGWKGSLPWTLMLICPPKGRVLNGETSVNRSTTVP